MRLSLLVESLMAFVVKSVFWLYVYINELNALYSKRKIFVRFYKKTLNRQL